MTVPAGWLQLQTTDPPLTLIARLSDERPNVDSGYGGWESVERPRRSPLTTWKNAPPIHMTVGLLLDGWQRELSVEGEIAKLHKMARDSGSDGQPPRVKISTTGAAVPFQDRSWVIDKLDFGDALMSPIGTGNRRRQQVSIGLLEYIKDVHLAEASKAVQQKKKVQAKKKKPSAAKKRTVTPKRGPTKPKKKSGTFSVEAQQVLDQGFGMGEDLVTLAVREYGDASRWIDIAQANGLRDPRAVPAGMVLRLP